MIPQTSQTNEAMDVNYRQQTKALYLFLKLALLLSPEKGLEH